MCLNWVSCLFTRLWFDVKVTQLNCLAVSSHDFERSFVSQNESSINHSTLWGNIDVFDWMCCVSSMQLKTQGHVFLMKTNTKRSSFRFKIGRRRRRINLQLDHRTQRTGKNDAPDSMITKPSAEQEHVRERSKNLFIRLRKIVEEKTIALWIMRWT